jgi:hypothetical protein
VSEETKKLSQQDEIELVKDIVRRGIYISLHLKEAKELFDPLKMDMLSYHNITISDIVKTPVSFIIEEVKTKSYVQYNSRAMRVRYLANSIDVLESMFATLDSMKLELDIKVYEVLRKKAGDVKALVSKNKDKEINFPGAVFSKLG